MEHTKDHGLTKCQIWKQRLQDFQASGMAQKEWCRQNQISGRKGKKISPFCGRRYLEIQKNGKYYVPILIF